MSSGTTVPLPSSKNPLSPEGLAEWAAHLSQFFNPPSSLPNPMGPYPTHPSTRGGFPPQKANKYIHSKVPPGILVPGGGSTIFRNFPQFPRNFLLFFAIGWDPPRPPPPPPELLEGVGWIAGYGCHEPPLWEEANHLPVNKKQTINRAELMAVIVAVRRTHTRQHTFAVTTDSSYVYRGVQGSAIKWRAQHWVTNKGPVLNVDLWIEPLELLD